MKNMNPHKGHRGRMRQRYKKQSFDGFADHEVLEFLLYYCYPRQDTNEIAHKMLNEFGSFHNLLEADIPTLMAKLKCTENIAIFINMLPKVANRYFNNRWGDKIFLDTCQRAAAYAMDLFVGYTVESFYVLCLDVRYRLIHAAQVSVGTVNETAAYPREIISVALQNNAVNVILAHNHPGGTIKPSPADNEVTRTIFEGMTAIKIKLIDHIIVAGDMYYSYANVLERRYRSWASIPSHMLVVNGYR
ncbi:MAG: DNA repair protein RadC [Defluviitaleaceae bacterium]|nr:DNA repair protein RadC [Defluviitaleaceae bacterium]